MRSQAQAGGGDILQRFDDPTERMRTLPLWSRQTARHLLVRCQSGCGEIADLMTDGADQDARGSHHGGQTRALAITQILRRIPDERCQAQLGTVAECGQPYMGHERFAISAQTLTLHGGAQIRSRDLALQKALQYRQVRMHLPARQLLLLETEQMLSGAVGKQYAAFAVERQDPEGTRLDHHLQLSLSVDAQPHLPLPLPQMLHDGKSLAIQVGDEIARQP